MNQESATTYGSAHTHTFSQKDAVPSDWTLLEALQLAGLDRHTEHLQKLKNVQLFKKVQNIIKGFLKKDKNQL